MNIIHVEPGSELERLLAEAAEAAADLETGDARYRVARIDRPAATGVTLADERDIWAGYDPERARAGLSRSAGAFAALTASSCWPTWQRNVGRTAAAGRRNAWPIALTRTSS